MILLQPVVEILAVAMPYTGAEYRPDRAGITVVPIRGHPVRRDAGGHLGGLEERLRGGHVAVFAEHHVDQRAGAIEPAILAGTSADGTLGRARQTIMESVG